MAFIANTAYELFAIGFGGLLLLYTVISMYLVYRRGKKNFDEYLESASIPLAVIGAYMLFSGFWGQSTWTLPGSYNILFYDPLVSFGIILIAFALSVRYQVRLEYAGVLALRFGIMLFIYGTVGYNIGLTTEPIALLGLYYLYGLVGIFAYPMSLMIDRLPGFDKSHSWVWDVSFVVFCAALLVGSLLAVGIGAMAIPQHLLTAP